MTELQLRQSDLLKVLVKKCDSSRKYIEKIRGTYRKLHDTEKITLKFHKDRLTATKHIMAVITDYDYV